MKPHALGLLGCAGAIAIVVAGSAVARTSADRTNMRSLRSEPRLARRSSGG
jgi:hypothetical protein